MKRHTYIVIALISVATVLFGSCSSELLEDLPTTPGNSVVGEDDGMVDVTIAFNVEDLANRATRADGATRSDAPDLNKIDLLVYALRDSSNQILYQYGKGIVDSDLEGCPALENYTSTDDNNQTLLKINWEEDAGKYKITLRVMRGMVFKLSCWTQSSKCKAYNFNSLEDVKVDYKLMAINDESYDAFCATSIFSVGQVDADITVTLTRPFAQINVGVSDDATNDALTLGEGGYQYSKIELDGVYTSFNVVENKVNAKSETAESVTIGYSPLPTGDDAKFDAQVWNTNTDNLIQKKYKSLGSWFVLVPETSYEYGEDGEIKDDANTGNNEENSKVEGGVISPAVKAPTLILKSFSLAKIEDGKESDVITYSPKDDEGNPLPINVKRNWRTNLLFENWDWTGQGTSRTSNR